MSRISENKEKVSSQELNKDPNINPKLRITLIALTCLALVAMCVGIGLWATGSVNVGRQLCEYSFCGVLAFLAIGYVCTRSPWEDALLSRLKN